MSVEDNNNRHVRNKDYILNDMNRLRPVVEIWEDSAKANQSKHPEREQAARKTSVDVHIRRLTTL